MKNILLNTIKEEQKKYIKNIVLEKDDVLFRENERCENIGIVIAGEIRIVSYLESGKEIIYNELTINQVFGNNLIFSSEPFYKGDVVAKEKTELCLIDKENLIEIFFKNEEFLKAYLMIQSDFGKELNSRIKLLTYNNAYDRFEYYMSVNKGIIRYKSISDLAKTLNLTREALSRLVHKLEKDGKIILSHKTIKIKN